jgi:hypothetical protein
MTKRKQTAKIFLSFYNYIIKVVQIKYITKDKTKQYNNRIT